MVPVDVIASIVIATLGVGGTAVGAVRYFVRHEIQPLLSWMHSHETRHDNEREELGAALARQGLDPPDGWPAQKTVTLPEGGE